MTLWALASVCLGNGPIRFTRITVREGLSHNTVFGLLQDRQGYLWIATKSGLNRYDGSRFKVFKNEPGVEDTLSDSNAVHLVEDQAGGLWVSTWGGGLNRYDPRTEKFTSYQNDPDDPTSLSGDRIQSLFLDSAGDIWVGMFKDGLNKFNQESGTFTRYRFDETRPGALPDNRIWSICQNESGFLWVGTGNGLSRLEIATGQFENFFHDPDNPASMSSSRVQALAPASDGGLWVGTNRGLNHFDPTTMQFTRYQKEAENPKSLVDNDIYSIFADSRGYIWIGTANGITLIDPSLETFTDIRNIPGDSASLSSNVINEIHQDRSEVLWIATPNGINKVDLKPKKFRQYEELLAIRNSPNDINIGAIHEDRQGNLWLGNFNSNLFRFNREQDVFKSYDARPPGSDSNNVRAILEDNSGRLWVGSYNNGLFWLDEQRDTLVPYGGDLAFANALSSPIVRCLFEDSSGRFWVGTEAGPNLLDGATGGFISARNHPFLERHFQATRVNVMLEIEGGDLLIGTWQGLARIDQGLSRCSLYKKISNDATSLSDNRIYCLLEDRNGGLWVGTNSGLNYREPGQEAFRRFFTKQGLPSNAIVGILADWRGMLWISTENGLVRLDPADGTFRIYDIYDGLQDAGFNEGSAFKSQSGEMFFGGTNGINSFFPDQVHDNPYIPPIVITSFKRHTANGLMDVRVTGLEEVRLSEEDSFFSLEFAALDFTNPVKNQYAYKFEEGDWIYTGNDHTVSFPRLQAGRYAFRIKGSNDDGRWNESGRLLRIEVVPPWWKSRIAVVFYLLVAIAAALCVPIVRIRNLKKREEELAEVVLERTSEIRAKNRQLGDMNKELLTLDEIVRAINREVDLEQLCQVLLRQSLQLFPKAEKGRVLIYDKAAACFRVLANTGYDANTVITSSFTRMEAEARFIAGTKELKTGVFMIEEVPEGQVVKSRLAMSVMVREEIDGYLVLESYEKTDIFKDSDVDKLARLREHAISAVAKARLFKDLTETAENLEKAQQKLVVSAHRAGMAEIAAELLHNLGNTLNSINTSIHMVIDYGKTHALVLFQRITALLEANLGNLEDYLLKDARGKQIPAALVQVSRSLMMVQQDMQEEVSVLQEHIAYLEKMINAQKEYAQSGVFSQAVDLMACIQDVLLFEQTLLESNKVQVATEFAEELPQVIGQKPQIVRVLVKLLTNSVEAMADNIGPCLLTLRCAFDEKDKLLLSIADNGRGIPAANLRRIFNQGFSTKIRGDGFGLHYCANTMKEMGGSIEIDSAGPGYGTTVVLGFKVSAGKIESKLDLSFKTL